MALIFTGSILLMMPISTTEPISFTEALFTSTSAVCVTGLIVVDTATRFTLAGKIILLILIQLGGLGIMTFSIGILSLMGGEFSLKWRVTFESVYSDIKAFPVKSVLRRILLYTFIIESLTALSLFLSFKAKMSTPEALWHAVFQSVSAFCNAGFSTFSDSMIGFQNNPGILLTISTAVILGGLGFIVISELSTPRQKKIPGASRYSIHTKLVLWASAILLLLGTVVICALEWNNSLSPMSQEYRVLNGFFQSMTCRTAGFNSIDIGSLRESTLFFMISLMFIGGSPGSIAGGIKTTTIAVVAGLIYSKIRGKRQVVFWKRAIKHNTVEKSTTLIILSLLFIYLSTFTMLFAHSFDIHHSFISGLFEITSAFGTVGLSTGITNSLSTEGKYILILVMFVGRLGPLTLIAALTKKEKEIPYLHAEENIMIG